MKLVTCIYNQRQHLGVLLDDSVVIPALSPLWESNIDNMIHLINAGRHGIERLQYFVTHNKNDGIPLNEVDLLAPIPRPSKNIMCMGWNYMDHVYETSAAANRKATTPQDIIVFTKNILSVNSPYGDVPIHANVSRRMDWEVELGVIIGRHGRDIAEQNALSHVFGYAVINDITARDRQERHKQFFLGKSLDGTCPMGPCVVTADEIPNPQNLDLRCWVNDELKQDSNTRLMIFSVAHIISVLSQGMSLESGDIIATGTPSGVGFARNPPEYLATGDIVECEVEKIGRLRNRMV